MDNRICSLILELRTNVEEGWDAEVWPELFSAQRHEGKVVPKKQKTLEVLAS
jgi:hypothetical protein